MKKRRDKTAVIPLSLAPKKKYPFPTPIRPGTVVVAKRSPCKSWRENIGRHFRIGYYSKRDGFDCIWLVNEQGKYEQTVDHEFLYKHFEITALSNERSLYGRNRPKLKAIS